MLSHDDGVDVEFLGGDLEVVAARAGDHHPMPASRKPSAIVRPRSVSPPVTSTSIAMTS